MDYTTARGQLRLLISDVDETRQVLTDDMVDGYLARWSITPGTATEWRRGPVARAAADALDAIATSETLVSKVIRTQDVATDGAKVADALRKQAQALRAQADQDDLDEAPAETLIAVAEFEPYPPRAW